MNDGDYFFQISGASFEYDLKQGSGATAPLQHVTHIEVGGATVFDVGTMPAADNTICYRTVM